MTDLRNPLVEEPAASKEKSPDVSGATTITTSKDWTIKALPADVVEQTRQEARRSGMKINAWVTNALRSAASPPRVHNSVTPRLSDDRIAEFEKGILEQLKNLQQRNEELTHTINSMSSMLIRIADIKSK